MVQVSLANNQPFLSVPYHLPLLLIIPITILTYKLNPIIMTERTTDEKYDLIVTAIKANRECKNQRQNLSLLRFNPIGKYIEPEIAKDAAIGLVNCFQRIHLNPSELERRKVSVDCLKSGGNCKQEIQKYLQA